MTSVLRQRLPVEVVVSDKVEDSSDSDSGCESGPELPSFTPPTFTIKEILAAIPAHCFERSALRSGAYVVRDFTFIGSLMYAASFIDPFVKQNLSGWSAFAVKWALWNVYWLLTGFVFTGVWITAHECGHQAFSTSKSLNNAMGLVLHSFVLVPYHSWRISHAKHHAATGHMTRDEVFVPATRSQKVKGEGTGRKAKIDGHMLDELLEDAPAYRLFYLLVQQLFGWPAYLFNNASGQNWYPKGTNHFDPKSLIFDARHRKQVLLSDAGLIAMLSALTVFGNKYGLAAVLKYYFVPYVYVNHWLVMITYLQHTDPMLPHYRAGEWSFQRGALCTIDRQMLGPIVGPYLMHGICETHVAHHLCSKIPHYNAWEATEALKVFLGEHYLSTDENMFVSLWKNFRSCRFVEDEGEVVFYKDAFGRGQKQVSYAALPSDSGVDVQESS